MEEKDVVKEIILRIHAMLFPVFYAQRTFANHPAFHLPILPITSWYDLCVVLLDSRKFAAHRYVCLGTSLGETGNVDALAENECVLSKC